MVNVEVTLHSTVTSLIHITDRWFSNIDKGLVTGLVFIDLCKAFDTVDINILLLKLTDMESVVLKGNGLKTI